ncbi:Crp/Fnr family transcriptional regulator [Saccharicrinis aurantiacus]|uniref:Crp/Fnr family transcriptional regulator n=1 Tax=Saccharicrinis aurantiacus TaxID=1849719 RepID=UPI0009502AF3|nr:Crp/Fnr family transcriptional regulator [Saccharicrinis aurantiacus]
MEITELVKKHFPSLLEPELLADIEKYCSIKTIDANQNFINIADDVIAMPLLIKGSIKIVREDDMGNELLLYYLNGGETCASIISCCMNRAISEVRATVIDEATAIMVPIKYMDEWLQKYSSWRSFIMIAYRTRFEELLKTVDSIAFLKMDERLEKYLIQRSKDTNTLILQGTHQEIADDLHTSREVVSRLLKQLEKIGRVKLSRNKIDVSTLF